MRKGTKALKYLERYLENHNIRYARSKGNGCIQVAMIYAENNAPRGYVESNIWFYENDYAEARCYYNAAAAICRNGNHRNDLLRLLNFINARAFLSCGAPYGMYEPRMLYNPRIYLTEDDGYDIAITTVINYDFWELAPLETNDYLTAYCPEFLGRLAPPIFGVLLGKMTVDDAITYIKVNILDEELFEGKSMEFVNNYQLPMEVKGVEYRGG